MGKSKRPAPLSSSARREANIHGAAKVPTHFGWGNDRIPLRITTHASDNPADVRVAMEEAYRKSPALQVADRILSGFNRPEEEQPSLADLFIANTYAEPSRYKGRMRKEMSEAMLRYRLDVQRAHRFVLSDDFVTYATEAASVSSDKILNRIHAATLPYEQTWVEFNLHQKVKTIRRLHKSNDTSLEDIAPRVGMLMQRINDTDAVATMIAEPSDRRPLPHLTSYFLTTREVDFFSDGMYRSYYGCRPFHFDYEVDRRQQKLQELLKEDGVDEETFVNSLLQIGKGTLWGYSKHGGGMLPKDGPIDMVVPEKLIHHGDAGYSRMYEPIHRAVAESEGSADKLLEMVINELREFSGQMRWIVTVLAMLNEVPINADLVQRPQHIRVGPTQKRQYMDYHRVTLKLPKSKPLRFIERKLGDAEAARRRAHEVRSHWRYYLRGEPPCKRDRHDWVWDEENGYRLCGKCFSWATLIHEHVRGDPNLGWIRKDYVIEKER
jgi:hypothetical protein